MSVVKVQGNASGTGIFTVAAPATNTDRTLTLPDQTGTILSNAGPFTANASASNGAVTIDASNNVGIGTSSPQFTSSNRLSVTMNATTDVIQPFVVGGNVKGFLYASASEMRLSAYVSTPLTFNANNSEAARIDTSGNFGIGITSPDCALTIGKNPGTGSLVFHITRPGIADNVLIYAADAYGPNGAAATFKIGSQSSTGRSINATGTINASGADYAEYMTKAGDFTVAKGDVVGINAEGKLTNVFAEAVSFVVKSTDPSYVGGDAWGTKDAIGHGQPAPLPDDATDEEKAAHAEATAQFETALEAARQKVDRIAFAGQVPVNVLGATPGQYIVPADDNGGIKGVAKNEADMTLAEYISAVGKVIAIEADGRAKIIVKVA